MTSRHSQFSPRSIRRAGLKLLQAASLTLAVALALPALAADARPIKTRVAPIYPEIAKRMKIEGTVRIEAIVDADGKVSDVKTVSGHRALAPAAEDAVRKWRFVPAPDQSTVTVDIVFAL
jgi:TonB family protein